MLEKLSKPVDSRGDGGDAMSDVAVAQQLLHEAFADAGMSVKARLRKAAVVLRLPPRRVRAIWYGEARRIDAHEMEAIRNAQAKAVAARLSRMRAALARIDPEFFEPDILALERVERQARRFVQAAGAAEGEEELT